VTRRSVARDAIRGEDMQNIRKTVPIADEGISSVAHRIRAIDRQSGWLRAIAIGRIIIDEFFGGDPQAWRSRRRGDNSLRRLAAHPDCPLQKSALAEAVGVFIAVLEDPSLPSGGVLTPSHVASVLCLEQPARRRLLKEAETQNMSVRSFEARVKQVREVARPETNRHVSGSRKVLNKVQEGLGAIRAARALAEGLVEMRSSPRSELAATLNDLEEEIELTRSILARLAPRPLLARSDGAELGRAIQAWTPCPMPS